MVEYKKKFLKLQNGGFRNYYSKLYKNGTEKKITKNEYLKKMSGGMTSYNQMARYAELQGLNVPTGPGGVVNAALNAAS